MLRQKPDFCLYEILNVNMIIDSKALERDFITSPTKAQSGAHIRRECCVGVQIPFSD